MKIVIAPDSFKGSLTSQEVITYVKKSAQSHFPYANIVEVPMADGGDGTIEALVFATGGTILSAAARDPLGRTKTCIYGGANGAAIIGMSECSGLAGLVEAERNPMKTSSHGTGDVIRQAMNDGFSEIYIDLGGSATNDCGTGALQALGMRFFRKDGNEIQRMCGEELGHVEYIDDTKLDQRLRTTQITVMCDVTNPLTRKDGATHVYGPQKGGTPTQLDILEAGMLRFERILNDYAGRVVTLMPGAGAAGGIGCALHAFLGATMCSGIDAMLKLVKFKELIADADLIVTGEGQVDHQSAYGKVVHGVTKYGKAAYVPVVVIAGSIGNGAGAMYSLGVNTILALPEAPMSLEACIANAGQLVEAAANRMFSLIHIGRNMQIDSRSILRTL